LLFIRFLLTLGAFRQNVDLAVTAIQPLHFADYTENNQNSPMYQTLSQLMSQAAQQQRLSSLEASLFDEQ